MALKNKNTLICDEVRVENTGKYFVIGLYSGPIVTLEVDGHEYYTITDGPDPLIK